MKVLIVDDNQSVASVVQLVLELEGYEVRSALNGPDGYLAYLQFRPDIVITDIQMPGKDGFELMKHIREEDATIRTIYMSGDLGQFHSILEEEKSKYQINLLEKPFSSEELIGRVSELVH
jgi:DNA-binding response OmpR family regulator